LACGGWHALPPSQHIDVLAAQHWPPQPWVGPAGHRQAPLVGSQLAPTGHETHAPSQTASPAGHWQEPAAHVAPVGQTRPHCPQSRSSVWRFAQRSAQTSGSDAGQAQLAALQASFTRGHR
jgi:hypothetical protein